VTGVQTCALPIFRKAGLDPQKDVTIVQQQADMNLFLERKIDAAQAMIYNQYEQVLEAKNPKTGKNYTPADLLKISMEELGTGMPQDGIYVRSKWLAESGHEDLAVRFLHASFQGWEYCRDHPQECVEIVMAVDPKLNRPRMEWMMKEVNTLIWPSPAGIGIMDESHWQRTAELSEHAGILKAAPTKNSYRTDLAKRAQ